MHSLNQSLLALFLFFVTTISAQEKKSIFQEAVAKDGAHVIVTVDNLEYSMFQISGEGFTPHESLNFISNSSGEVIYFLLQADKNGNFPSMGFLPAVIGKSEGICHIDVLREKDSIHLKFPWGRKLPSQ